MISDLDETLNWEEPRWRVDWGMAGHVTYVMTGLFVKWDDAIKVYEALPGTHKAIEHIGPDDDSYGDYDTHLESKNA